ncbi:MAG: phospholipase D family protein [Anaerolineales bacterium]
MAKIQFQYPSDQPSGNRRLLEELKSNLGESDLHRWKIVVAFAQQGPLLRMEKEIDGWRESGRQISAVIGLDLKGTSVQALEFALDYFDATYVVLSRGGFWTTFHPKVYLFEGKERTVAYVGSNNLTPGGTETNSESYVRLEIDPEEEREIAKALRNLWADSRSVAIPLTRKLKNSLESDGVLLDESRARPTRPRGAPKERDGVRMSFPQIQVSPPSPIPARSLKKRKPPATKAPQPSPQASLAPGARALVMQVLPHSNGEVLLSKTAVDQHPLFFGWPFTGRTTPKKASNPSYPQRLPDPIVTISVYDAAGARVVQHLNYGLNTVYYERKSEIRITVPQDVVQNAPDYSILVMQHPPPDQGYDYDLEFYAPGSSTYSSYLRVCNQSLPSGGKPQARRFGWI